MKDMQSVISEISNRKEFKKLNEFLIINKLIAALPFYLRKSFLFSSIKGRTLFLAMNHPSISSEINNHKKEIFLNQIKQIKKIAPLDSNIQKIEDIRAYVPNNILGRFNTIKSKTEKIEFYFYIERAFGDFEIENGDFANHFEKIKTIIKNVRNDQESS